MLILLKNNKMFRKLLAYQIFSGLGGGVFSLFMLLSIHMIYENPIYTGIAGFLMAAPHIIAFAMGPIVDRRNKVSILRITTFLEFAVLALLSFTLLQETFGIILLFAVVTVFSFSALFEGSARTAYLPQIVIGDELMQANALLQISSFGGGLLVATGLFLVLGNTTLDFRFIYGISTVFLAIALVFSFTIADPSTPTKTTAKPGYMQDLLAGGKFIRQSVLLFITVATVAKMFSVEMSNVNRPAFLEYHVGAQGYIIFAMAGLLGGILASAIIGTLGNKISIGWLICGLFVMAGGMRIVSTLVIPVSYWYGLGTTVLYAILGTALSTVKSTLFQKTPPKDMVARVNTIQTTFVAIFATIGALFGGFLGNVVADVGQVFIYQGIVYVVIGLMIILVSSIRKLPKMNEI